MSEVLQPKEEIPYITKWKLFSSNLNSVIAGITSSDGLKSKGHENLEDFFRIRGRQIFSYKANGERNNDLEVNLLKRYTEAYVKHYNTTNKNYDGIEGHSFTLHKKLGSYEDLQRYIGRLFECYEDCEK